MKKLLILSISLALCYGLIVTVAIWLGRQQKSPELFEQLYFNECELPCWINIVPGKTTIVEADALLYHFFGAESVSLLRELSSSKIYNIETSGYLDLRVELAYQYPVSDAQIISYIYIAPLDKRLIDSLPASASWKVINAFGFPKKVAVRSKAYYLLFDNEHTVGYSFNEPSNPSCMNLAPYQKIQGIYIFNSYSDVDPTAIFTLWQGFQCYKIMR
jgi:hypothetical protein